MLERNYIVWDLGATKCAAALVRVRGDAYEIIATHSVKLKECDSLFEMAQTLHHALGVTPHDVDAICVGGAGQYNGEELILATPYPFPMRFAKVAAQQDWPVFFVVHDYTPIVCSTFLAHQNKSQIRFLNDAVADEHGRRVAFGVGTGLGVKDAVMLPTGEMWLGVNEMGHIGLTLPPKMNRVEASVHREFVRFYQEHDELRGGAITFESVLSGKGLARIHQFIRGAKHRLTPEETAEEIKATEDEETLRLFAWYLGLFIGTLQLTFMPTGGIWINGGVINKNLELFDAPYLKKLFRGMQSCSAYLECRKQQPLNVLVGQSHAYLGAAFYVHRCFPNKARVCAEVAQAK